MKDNVFTMRSTPYKFGPGVTDEIGDDLVALGLRRVLVVTDPGVAENDLTEREHNLDREKKIEAGQFHVDSSEPTHVAVKMEIKFPQVHNADGYVAIGGGRDMVTTKTKNL